MQDYRKTLLRLPANMKVIPQYKGKTVQEILKMPIERPMSDANVNKYMNRASSLFHYAVRRGFMDKNPAEGMQIKDTRKDHQKRKRFSGEDLNRLFRSKEYLTDSHKHSYAYWLPILGAFTGCRIEELCQLHLNDIRQEEGLWILDINETDEKGIKTDASRRHVPIHPFILDDLDFIAYVDDLRKKGHTRLFPEITQRKDGTYGRDASKWFGRYRKRCGVVEEGKCFHSFRHTVADELKQHLVEDSVIHEFWGMN